MKWAKGQKPAAALLQGDSLVNQLGNINFGFDLGNLIGHSLHFTPGYNSRWMEGGQDGNALVSKTNSRQG